MLSRGSCTFIEWSGLDSDAMEQQRQIKEAEHECFVELKRTPLYCFGRLVGNLTLDHLAMDFSESHSISAKIGKRASCGAYVTRVRCKFFSIREMQV